MQVRCGYCEREYESTAEGCDHWPNGPEKKCAVQLSDDAQFHAEGQIKQTKIDRRTGHDDRWPDPNRGR